MELPIQPLLPAKLIGVNIPELLRVQVNSRINELQSPRVVVTPLPRNNPQPTYNNGVRLHGNITANPQSSANLRNILPLPNSEIEDECVESESDDA